MPLGYASHIHTTESIISSLSFTTGRFIWGGGGGECQCVMEKYVTVNKRCEKSAQMFRLTLKLSIDSHSGSSSFNSFVFTGILQ